MAKKLSLTNHSTEELSKLVDTKREELRGLRFGAAGSKNKNVKLARVLRKDIARALTETKQRSSAPAAATK